MSNPRNAARYSPLIAFLLIGIPAGGASATPLLVEPVSYSFETIDAPASSAPTQLNAINNAGIILGGGSYSFLYSGGVFTTPTLPAGAIPTALNDTGHLVGILNNSAFLDADGVFTVLNDPDGAVFPGVGTVTQAFGVNNKDQVIGVFEGPGHFESFLYDNGGFSTIADPVAYFNDGPPGSGPFSGGGTFVGGINDSGTIVGSYTDITGTYNAFVLSNGTFTTINDPLAPGGELGGGGSNASDINNNGDVVGSYYDDTGTRHGFLDVGGAFTTIDVPGSNETVLYGINDAGQIVGSYLDENSMSHGFLATPFAAVPEAATWAMMLSGFGLIGFLLRRSRGARQRQPAKLSPR